MAADVITFDTQHEDMIHDCQLDYYGKRLATCSSDCAIRIFDTESDNRLLQILKGHEGPVWQVAWAHPKFGNVLASCSYDSKVFIWKEVDGTWTKVYDHTVHTASVNSVSWAPHEHGAILACASSDGRISILSYEADGSWKSTMFEAHAIGCNAVAWAPAVVPGLFASMSHSSSGNRSNVRTLKRFATAGCDNLVKIWVWKEDTNSWKEEVALDGHVDWVRDLAWAPSTGLSRTYLASCSQDKTVIIWSQDSPTSSWNKKPLKNDKFPDVVWRVSWSPSGNILAVSCGDNKITLWKENLDEQWEVISEEEAVSSHHAHSSQNAPYSASK